MSDFMAVMEQACKGQPGGGGYLIPETIQADNPGWRARCWRILAGALYRARIYGWGYRCMERGTHRERHPLWAALDRLHG